MKQHSRISGGLVAHGVVWHPCAHCALPWPFPLGSDGDEARKREWACHRCVQALYAKLRRAHEEKGTNEYGNDHRQP